jgi:hypothetical protein
MKLVVQMRRLSSPLLEFKPQFGDCLRERPASSNAGNYLRVRLRHRATTVSRGAGYHVEPTDPGAG